MKLDVLKIDGTASGKQVELDETIFGIEPNDNAIYLDVKQAGRQYEQPGHRHFRCHVARTRPGVGFLQLPESLG